MNAITKDDFVRPVRSNKLSFIKTLMKSVDIYNKTKNITLFVITFKSTRNVYFWFAKYAKTVPIKKLEPFEIKVSKPICMNV